MSGCLGVVEAVRGGGGGLADPLETAGTDPLLPISVMASSLCADAVDVRKDVVDVRIDSEP